ncbi:hypothetical protein GBA52_002949 [Prunus armeniaca]|nr:hypothetical protein GBA52_002949 [Prunus armeniaca]
MRPPGSIPIKDYAIDTPLNKSALPVGGDQSHEVKIDVKPNSAIAAINFVLKDEETGAWYQHRGRDFRVPLVDYLQEDENVVGAKWGLGAWPGSLGKLSNAFVKAESPYSKDQDSSNESRDPQQKTRRVEEFYEELAIAKEIAVNNSVTVSVRKCPETAKNLLCLETDLPDHVVVHWGVCRDDTKRWEIPAAPHTPETVVFKDKALRTRLQVIIFEDHETHATFSNHSIAIAIPREVPSEDAKAVQEKKITAYTNGIINEIRNLVSDISSEKNQKTKSKEAQESILQEIEKLASEAHSIFRSTVPTFTEEAISETEELKAPAKICSGTGTGFEILCQGFNWESHKSGRWYMELQSKAAELSSLGFTVIWLPPPTDSVSPEGYMPKDLYNLNSRGNKSSGECFHAAPNIDHSQDFVRKDIKEWLHWLSREEIGYDGWRLDFVRGFWGGYVKDYIDSTEPYFAVGEYWDSLCYTYGEMDHNQDAHRQRIVDWINATNGTAGAFDVTTKGILHANIFCRHWKDASIGDSQIRREKPPGVLGWWPSRAVTFIENHDTGSTQGHWRFPHDKEMQGYDYILTHPGTPTVFYDHIFSHYHSEIKALLSLRNRNKLNCRSRVKITKAERDVYAAIIDEKVAVKIGPGHYEPQSGPRQRLQGLESIITLSTTILCSYEYIKVDCRMIQ